MTKLSMALLLLSACTTEGEIFDDPETGPEGGVQAAPKVTGVVRGVAEGRVVLGNDRWVDSREISGGGFSFHGVPDGTYFAKLEVAGYASGTQTVVVSQGAATVEIEATPLLGGFEYQWSLDASRGGHEQGTVVGSARMTLRSAYGIELSDEELVWTDEHAARLLETMRSVPQTASTVWAPIPMAPTTWVLSTGEAARAGDVVRMPAAAFATGRYVAADLHTEIVAHVTQHGRDRVAVDKILLERFGVRAWLFSDAEMVTLISMLEDMPERLRSMPQLATVIRRQGGTPMRSSVLERYLEIGDIAFTMERADAQFALVREKARFLVSAEMAEEVARFVVTGQGSAPGFETQRPITKVAIRADGRQVSIQVGLQAETTYGNMFVFNGERYQHLGLDTELGTRGTVVHGEVSLSAGGIWRPDMVELVGSDGVAQFRDMTEVGWRLEVE